MNIYETAIDILNERGWTQGVVRNAKGEVCLIGALGIATGRIATNNGYCSALETCGRKLGIPVGSVITWNDAPERSKEDVILILKELASEA